MTFLIAVIVAVTIAAVLIAFRATPARLAPRSPTKSAKTTITISRLSGVGYDRFRM